MKKFLIAALFVCLLGGGGYFAALQYDALEQQRAADEARLQKLTADQKVLDDLGAVYLNDFKADLKKAGQDYKDYSRVLADITEPDNYSTPEDARQTYLLFTEEITPALRQKAQALLDVFSTYKAKMDSEEVDARDFRAEWASMHDEQLAYSVSLLSHDETLVQAYEVLVAFLYQHSNLYTVDLEAQEFAFKRPEDAEKYGALKNAIRVIRREKLTLRGQKQ